MLVNLDALDCFLRALNSLVLVLQQFQRLHVRGCNYIYTFVCWLLQHSWLHNNAAVLWRPHVFLSACHGVVCSHRFGDSCIHGHSLMAIAIFCAKKAWQSVLSSWGLLISTYFCVQTSSADKVILNSWCVRGRISRVPPPWSQTWSQSILDGNRMTDPPLWLIGWRLFTHWLFNIAMERSTILNR